MAEQSQPDRSLSDISHLFLSSVRRRQTDGAAPPRRKPPQADKPAVSIDMTPEEFADMLNAPQQEPVERATVPLAPMRAVLAVHLNGSQRQRVFEYARHLAAGGRRVGLILADTHELSLHCFDSETSSQEAPVVAGEPRQISEALEELNFDVDQWILGLLNPHSPESKSLLRRVEHWVALCTCDHDGVVSCYRTLKGLSDCQPPRLTLALLDACDQGQATAVFRKLAGVCEQFLHWPMQFEPAVVHGTPGGEHCVLRHRGPHGNVLAEFLGRSAAKPAAEIEEEPVVAAVTSAQPHHVADVVVPTLPAATPMRPVSSPAEAHTSIDEDIRIVAQPPSAVQVQASIAVADHDNEVIDLPEGDGALLQAVLKRDGSQWITCPLQAPACPSALILLGRDRRLTLLAAAGTGLKELHSAVTAYQWLAENRALVAMALPQLAIDAHALPHLELLVEHGDHDAVALQGLVHGGDVRIRRYRRLTWAGRAGVLLDAA